MEYLALVIIFKIYFFFNLSKIFNIFYFSFLIKGGSISNLYALLTAKHYFYPESKTKGLYQTPKLIVFTSEHVSF